MHDRSLSWLGTGTLIKKNDVVGIVLWAQISPHSEMMWSCMCSPHMSKMSTLTHLIYRAGLL